MVEGHLVHRMAEVHRLLLQNKAFAASSPNGRFQDGARAINKQFLSHIEVHGKNIFYFFTRQKLDNAVLEKLPNDVVVVHIHFGMAGSFSTFIFPGPEPRETIRLRLQSEEDRLEAQLSASVCIHGDMKFYRKRIAKLGPDPLRIDADKELIWTKMQKNRKSIGAVFIDQSFIAGIGNIYRTEILFVAGVHPDQQASTIDRSTFEKLWSETVRLLRIGLVTGSIITVSQKDAGKPLSELKSEEWRYVYGKNICKLCKSAVLKWTCAARTVYACEVCQPWRKSNDTAADKISVEDFPALHARSNARTSDVLNTSIMSISEQINSPLRKSKKSSSSSGVRIREETDSDLQYLPMNDKSGDGGLDFRNSLVDLTWPRLRSKVFDRGLKNSPGKSTGVSRLYHSDAGQYAVINERTSWSTFTKQSPSRRIGFVMGTMQFLGNVHLCGRFGLQPFRTVRLDSVLPLVWTWSGRNLNPGRFIHV